MTLRFFYSAPPRKKKRKKLRARFRFYCASFTLHSLQVMDKHHMRPGQFGPVPILSFVFSLTGSIQGIFPLSLSPDSQDYFVHSRPAHKCKKMVYLSSRTARPKRRLISAISSRDRQTGRARAIPQKL